MKRYFNTTGYCRPDWHYMIEPLRGIEDEINSLIENRQYFLIHAPRQSGKTTLLHSIARKINSGGKYVSVVFSLERASYEGITHEVANYTMINALHSSSILFLPENEMPPSPEEAREKTLFEYINTWCSELSKPVVLFCDEVDSLQDAVLISVLRQFRDGFQLRPQYFPASIALVGLRDLRDYKMQARGKEGSPGSGSPFNIKAESFTLGNFTKLQIQNLYLQFTEETGQKFSDEVLELIYEYTGGQPWLVNALANEIVVKILKKDFTKEITPEIVDTAKENLIQRRDTHLDSLIDKLHDLRVKSIVESIISGEGIKNQDYNDNLQYTLDLGIVKRTPTGIKIANKIYNEIIPRTLNASFQDELEGQTERQWYITPEGKLDMNFLLKEFQKFYRRHSESWMDQFSYQEAGKQLLLMAYLQRVVNGGGKIDREMAYGRGRTDLVVMYMDEVFVLELKIKYDDEVRGDGLRQLSDYLDKAGLLTGYLIIFEPKSSKEIPWEHRIKWDETEFEYRGVKRKITVIEM